MFLVERTKNSRFTWSIAAVFRILRRLPVIRATLFGGTPRLFDEGSLMDVCLAWNRKNFHRYLPVDMNVLPRRGLLHVTLCGHEGVRPIVLRHTKVGAWANRMRYTTRLNIAAFVFILSVEWCHTPNFENLGGLDGARR